MLYIALKLVEFEYNRNHEVMNIMLIEEPEAHIHAHIQKTLFDKLQISTEYTQVVMTTHSAQLSEIAEIKKVNVMKIDGLHSVVMQPCNGLDEFGEKELKLNKIKLSKRLEKYLESHFCRSGLSGRKKTNLFLLTQSQERLFLLV